MPKDIELSSAKDRKRKFTQLALFGIFFVSLMSYKILWPWTPIWLDLIAVVVFAIIFSSLNKLANGKS